MILPEEGYDSLNGWFLGVKIELALQVGFGIPFGVGLAADPPLKDVLGYLIFFVLL